MKLLKVIHKSDRLKNPIHVCSLWSVLLDSVYCFLVFRYFLFLFLFYVHKTLIQFFVHSIIYIWQETHSFHTISNTPFRLSRIILCCLARCSAGKSPQCSCREPKFSSYYPHRLFLQLLLLVVVVYTCNSGAWTKEAGK